MSLCTITPDRGDRPQFFERCIHQLKMMNDGCPQNAYLMNEKPKSEEVDLIPRIREGIKLAKRDGFTHVYIIESDDAYPVDYLKRPLDFDFFGFNETIYYHLRNRTWQKHIHLNRSSLFCTAFKISALDKFKWPKDNATFLDIELWKFASRGRFKVKLQRGNPCLGIKHGIGKVGGKAHGWKMRHEDNDLSFLKSRLDEEAFEFYKTLMLTL
jgi:hypothetical protein